jgi:hypothetical protein
MSPSVELIFSRAWSEKGYFVQPEEREEKTPKKPYSTPQLKKIEFEQAAIFLVGHAYNNSDAEARELLEVMFPDTCRPSSKNETRPADELGNDSGEL